MLRRRILDLLDGPASWPTRQGHAWRYWRLRQVLGGRYNGQAVRRSVDTLMEAGLVIEVLEEVGGRCAPRHTLCRVDKWDATMLGRVIEVRGRRDALEALDLVSPVH